MFQLFFIISPIFLEIKYFFLYTMIKNSLCAFPPLYAEVSAMITDKSIEYIYTVYREGSFSKAAQKLYVSQPALSAMIRKTEAELHNIPLFDRSSKPIRLTQAGEYFISAVSQIMEIQNDITEYFDHLAGLQKGAVTLGSSSFFCSFVLPPILQDFQRTHPGAVFHLFEMGASDREEKLKTSQVDLILDVDAMDSRVFDCVTLGQEHVLLAVPAELEVNRRLARCSLSFQDVLARRHLDEQVPAVELSAFSGENFLFLKRRNDMYERASSLCRQAGFQPNVVMYMDQLMTVYNLAKSGQGTAFLSDSVVYCSDETDRLVFYKLDGPSAVRDVMLSYRKNSSFSCVVNEFVSFITRRGLGLPGSPGPSGV